MIIAAILVIFPLCLVIAAFSDMLTMTIPNRVSLLLLVSFPLIAVLAGLDVTQIAMHLAAGFLVFSVVFALFVMNTMGGGDAKLLATSAIWFGFTPALVEYLLYVSLLGGALTVCLLAVRARSSDFLALGLPIPAPLLMEKKIPYGIAIGLGGVLAFPSSPLMEIILHVS
jgi:prepilin peptidase CpaA